MARADRERQIDIEQMVSRDLVLLNSMIETYGVTGVLLAIKRWLDRHPKVKIDVGRVLGRS